MEITERDKMMMMYAVLELNIALPGGTRERAEAWVGIIMDRARQEGVWTSARDMLADFYEKNPDLAGVKL